MKKKTRNIIIAVILIALAIIFIAIYAKKLSIISFGQGDYIVSDAIIQETNEFIEIERIIQFTGSPGAGKFYPSNPLIIDSTINNYCYSGGCYILTNLPPFDIGYTIEQMRQNYPFQEGVYFNTKGIIYILVDGVNTQIPIDVSCKFHDSCENDGGCRYYLNKFWFNSLTCNVKGQLDCSNEEGCTSNGFISGGFVTKIYKNGFYPPICEVGQNQDCINLEGCTGTQTCLNNAWGECNSDLHKCLDGTCQLDCTIPPICKEDELSCSGDSLMICKDNQFIFKETCKDGCEEGKCKGFDWTIYLIWGIGIIIFIFSIFLIYLIIKLIGRKR